MSIHSIPILSHKKQYVHLPVDLLNKISELFGPSIARAWEVLYTESRATKGTLIKTYDYLAAKMGCSRKTAIRYVKRMAEKGILIVKKRFHHNCSLDNEFILLSPDEAIYATQNAPDRVQPDLDIDYSIDYSVEKQNSVDKSGTNCPPSILNIYKDINNTNQAAPITALRQNSKDKVPKQVLSLLKKVISGISGVSNPQKLLDEAEYFVKNRKAGYSAWQAAGAFRKLLGDGGAYSRWSTPWGMRK